MRETSLFAPCLALAAICGALFFWNLGTVPLTGQDEGLYAEAARGMLASGDYVLPSFNGQPFLDKPPLVYWLQAAAMRALGANSLAARLPSAVAGCMLIALTVFLGARLYDRRSGVLAGLVLATTLLTVGLARMAVMDMVLTLAVTAALGSFLLSYTGKLPRIGHVGLWVFAALAALVKGPVPVALILTTVAAFVVLRRNAGGLARAVPLGLVAFLAIAAPWYVLVQRASGGRFLTEFIIHQNIQRALGEDFQHNMPFYFYAPIYLVGFFPWSAFVPAAWRRLVKLRPKDGAGEASLFAAVWIVTIVALYSVSRSKLPAYIYPTFPASALLVGTMWAHAEPSVLKRSGFAALLVAAVLAAAMMIAPSRLRDPIPGLESALLPMSAALVLGCGVSYALLLRERTAAAFSALCAGAAAFLLVASLLGFPIAARSVSQPLVRMAARIKVLAGEGEAVCAYGFPPLPQLVFYSGRRVTVCATRPELDAALGGGAGRLVVTRGATDLPTGARLILKSEPYSLYRITPPSRESP